MCKTINIDLLINFEHFLYSIRKTAKTAEFNFFFFFLANSCQSIAVLMTCGQMSISLAFLQAVWTPKFWGWTSSLTVLSQVVLGLPAGLLQSAGGRSAAGMMQWWSSAGAVQARWPKNLRRFDLTTVNDSSPTLTPRRLWATVRSKIQYIRFRKRLGATVQPWRTPERTWNYSEHIPFARTQLHVSVYNSFRSSTILLGMPCRRRGSHGDSLSTESKVDFMSTYAIHRGLLNSLRICRSVLSILTLSKVDLWGVKPLFSGRRTSSSFVFIRAERIRAKAFPGVDRRVIPQ